jgi:hypothetical protein
MKYMSSQKNMFVIDPPLKYHNEELASNMNLGRINSMTYDAATIETE